MASTQISWDSGTGYDFLLSLYVLHNPEEFGLRAAWAAGVRSRLPAESRDLLNVSHSFWTLQLQWIYNLPDPKDAAAVLTAMRAMPAEQLLLTLFSPHAVNPAIDARLREVWTRNSWNDEDVKILLRGEEHANKKRSLLKKELTAFLDWWIQPQAFAAAYVAVLQDYYDAFCQEEESRIGPVLEKSLALARQEARKQDLPELLETLSQGVRLSLPKGIDELILIPVFWTTPLIIDNELEPGRSIFFFGVRPAEMSLVPGDVIPDLMGQALKALSDPARLRILRYLSEEPQTPTELANRLRLRPPTVIHHLHSLRLARLVHLTFEDDEKRYALRATAILEQLDALKRFLNITD